MPNPNMQTVQTVPSDSILARNKVLRQTYVLLGMNVLFSALCAYIGMKLNISLHWGIAMLGLFGLS